MFAHQYRVVTLDNVSPIVYTGRNASKEVQDALVCIVAQKIDHALRSISV